MILAVSMLLLQLATDAYLFFIAWQRSRKLFWAKFQLCESAFFLIYVIVVMCLPARTGAESGLLTVMWMILFYITVYAGKITFILVDLLSYIPLLFSRKRLSWLSWVALAAGVFVSLSVLWGAFFNRFRLQVNELTVEIPNLPQSFEGYRIAQISDLHVGTYGSDPEFLEKLVERVNSLEPDLIVFTGDLVNQRADELLPFVETLGGLSAPDGVFSILGNHDYGDYVKWDSPADKEENLESLMDLQIAMGWELLTNTYEVVRGQMPGDSLIIIGVENWGDPPFPQLGDLEASYPAPGDSAVKILLTHNPIHWVESVAPVDSINIPLTLSGHTHAMQFKVGSLSPARWRYPDCWAGRYDSPDGRRTLYVNIGTGTVGLPVRIGATPEITLITLRSSSINPNNSHPTNPRENTHN